MLHLRYDEKQRIKHKKHIWHWQIKSQHWLYMKNDKQKYHQVEIVLNWPNKQKNYNMY